MAIVDDATVLDEENFFSMAGFWRRCVAYLIDVLPITVLTTVVAYTWFGFDQTLQSYLSRQPGDLDAYVAFTADRRMIRDTSTLIYLLYAIVCESSPLQATLGKKCLGIVVVNSLGQRPRLGLVILRNLCKFISMGCCCLGFLWAAWSPRKQA